MSDKEDNALAISSSTCIGEKKGEGEGERDVTHVLDCESVS